MTSTAFYAMGSKISLEAAGKPPEIRELFRKTRTWFQDWEQCLSRFQPDSELSQLNQQSGQLTTISPVLWAVIRAAMNAARQTGGLVSPTILAALESTGYDRSFEKIEAAGSRHVPIQPGINPQAWRLIELNYRQRTVRLPEGVRIDLGGVAKGWAADRTARRLRKLAPVVVNAGGDIAISGPGLEGKPWKIGIASPEDAHRLLAELSILQGGVATSGRNYRKWEKDGKLQHHLIDPRTGLPADTDVLAASVVAPSALSAETAAKVVLILGSQAGLDWLEARPRLAGLLALENGQVLYSSRLSSYIR